MITISSIIKFKPVATTFVDSSHSNKNFSSLEKMLAGSIHTTASTSIMYKTLLSFDLSILCSCPIKYAYLFLHLKDINSDSSYYSNNNLSLYKNVYPFNSSKVTWNTVPETSILNAISIKESEVGFYTKFDLTNFFKNNISYDNLGITIEPSNYYSSLIKFSSVNSDNPPWLILKYNNLSC